ncbi:MAG: substrate-binding domain-containing protein [Candidatus Auribacterota bacterium]
MKLIEKIVINSAFLCATLIVLFSVPFIAGPVNRFGQSRTKELLIYCSTLLIDPVYEIARVIENSTEYTCVIHRDGSGNLQRTISLNKVGDLYFPGSEWYLTSFEDDDVVREVVLIGYNKAVLMVQKGNPLGISSDLKNLANKDYYVVMCNPDTGSIGRECKIICEKMGILEDVLRNARQFKTDARQVMLAVRRNEADLALNWYAPSVWKTYQDWVDVIPLDPSVSEPRKISAGLLKYSRYPDAARKLMQYAGSAQGRDLFKRYGF